MFKFKKNNKGFTLVELIIVVAVIVILATVLAPQYTRYVERSRQSNDLQIATTIMDAAVIAITDPLNEIPSDAVVYVGWQTADGGQNIVVGSGHGSGMQNLSHSNGLSLSANLANVIREVVSNQGNFGAESEAGKTQHFYFRVFADTGVIEVADTNAANTAANPTNPWNHGSGLWVTEIGVNAPLSSAFTQHNT